MATWRGKSGQTYEYTVQSATENIPQGGGNYIFIRLEGNTWYPLYIGETQNFVARLSAHDKIPCARQNGLNEIHYHTHNGNEQARRAEEQDLLQNYRTVCNG
ncbi:MAG: hypothetical protein OXE87_16665 [Chloroflexi bacterium]|nr:hypothetical protein [Chloroflexota bacterium]